MGEVEEAMNDREFFDTVYPYLILLGCLSAFLLVAIVVREIAAYVRRRRTAAPEPRVERPVRYTTLGHAQGFKHKKERHRDD